MIDILYLLFETSVKCHSCQSPWRLFGVLNLSPPFSSHSPGFQRSCKTADLEKNPRKKRPHWTQETQESVCLQSTESPLPKLTWQIRLGFNFVVIVHVKGTTIAAIQHSIHHKQEMVHPYLVKRKKKKFRMCKLRTTYRVVQSVDGTVVQAMNRILWRKRRLCLDSRKNLNLTTLLLALLVQNVCTGFHTQFVSCSWQVPLL